MNAQMNIVLMNIDTNAGMKVFWRIIATNARIMPIDMTVTYLLNICLGGLIRKKNLFTFQWLKIH
jgi:hypothetical protein